MSVSELLQSFATVFPAELPDKTMIATVVLVARYRCPLWVWVGASAAFAVHVTVAVAAGSAIGLLPDALVGSVVAALFTGGAIMLWLAARRGTEDVEVNEAAVATPGTAVIGSFGLVVLAEWGDLTQLATAGLAARSDQPLAIGAGALIALGTVAAIAAAFGRQLVERIPIGKINYAAAAVFAALAIWTIVELLV